MNIVKIQKFAHRLYVLKVPILPKLLYIIQFLIYNSSIPASVKMEKGVNVLTKASELSSTAEP